MRKISICHHRKPGREQLGKDLHFSWVAGSRVWPKRLCFPACFTKNRWAGQRNKSPDKTRSVCQVLSDGEPGPGSSRLPDAVPLTRGEPHTEVKILLPGREEQWTVHPQATETQPFPTTCELHHLDILDSSLFQGSGCCKDILSLLSHLLVEAGKLSTSALNMTWKGLVSPHLSNPT